MKEIDAAKPARVPAIPQCSWSGHWLTIVEFSRLMGRKPPTIYEWIREGTLSEFGIATYEFRFGRKHSARIFVRNPYL
jgi:hypothetical protein